MFWKAISILFRLIGLLDWAKGAWDKHEQWKEQNAKNQILTDSDADIAAKLSKYNRD